MPNLKTKISLADGEKINYVQKKIQPRLFLTYHPTRNIWFYFLLVESIFVIVCLEQAQCMKQFYSVASRRSIRSAPAHGYYYFLSTRKRTCPWSDQPVKHSQIALSLAKKSSHSSQHKAYNRRTNIQDSRFIPNNLYNANSKTPIVSTSFKRPYEKEQLQEDATTTSSPRISHLRSTLLDFQNQIYIILGKETLLNHIHECTLLFYKMIEALKISSSNSPDVNTLSQSTYNEDERFECSKIIDETIQHILQYTFDSMNQNRKKSSSTAQSWKNFFSCLELLISVYANQSPHSVRNIVSPPYHLISASTIRFVLRTLNSLIIKEDSKKKLSILDEGSNNYFYQEIDSLSDPQLIQSSLFYSYRLLQRWITGYGLRQANKSTHPFRGIQGNNSLITNESFRIQERDIAALLNAFVVVGDMNRAHRMIALQERSDGTPPLSPVAYSILIKGYSRLRDIRGIDAAVGHARRNHIQPDIVMCNGIIDAFINCGDVDKAYDLFTCIASRTKDTLTKSSSSSWNKIVLECRPNVRTFNTMLKGFVKTGNLHQSMILFNDMKRNGLLFDSVTVNTLVSVAVSASSFHIAESLLSNYTDSSSAFLDNNAFQQHPNVEAYTELIDGYGKAGRLSEAVQLLQTMRTRGVNPNEITYTSIIGALSRHRRIKQAKDMLQFMETVDRIRPGAITYNAMISGLLGSSVSGSLGSLQSDDDNDGLSHRIEAALEIYATMVYTGVKPNAITISTIIDALSRCQPSRHIEAQQILLKAVQAKVIRRNDCRVGTSMIRTYASIGDVEACLETYYSMERRDLVAFNTLLDSLCRLGKIKKALLIFSQLSSKKAVPEEIIPDVITYSILIGELLKVGSPHAMSNVRKLYQDMKANRGIIPDCGLIDM